MPPRPIEAPRLCSLAVRCVAKRESDDQEGAGQEDGNDCDSGRRCHSPIRRLDVHGTESCAHDNPAQMREGKEAEEAGDLRRPETVADGLLNRAPGATPCVPGICVELRISSHRPCAEATLEERSDDDRPESDAETRDTPANRRPRRSADQTSCDASENGSMN